MGAVFAIFSGITFWFHILTGVALRDYLLKIHFALMFLGVNVTFFPQHFLGLQGMPRRYSDYPDRITTWNIVRSSGRIMSIVASFYFIGIVWNS